MKLSILAKSEYKRKIKEAYDKGFAEGDEKGYKEAQMATQSFRERCKAELATAMGMLLRHAMSGSPEVYIGAEEIRFALPEDMIGQYQLESEFDPATRIWSYKVRTSQV